LHVEKDDQVIRHNNNKTWETKEKSIRKAFLFKTFMKDSCNYGFSTFTIFDQLFPVG
jgi:hypothetical protein